MTAAASTTARPIIKWAGGKRRLVPQIVRQLPDQIDTYYEPFVGGAAVFFALADEGRFRRAVLSDRNDDLVELYKMIQKCVDDVIDVLRTYEYGEEFYYTLRDRDPAALDPPERAARLIYLNKTGYNGLYRVNRSGRFNVPFGKYKRPPNFCDEKTLRTASRALSKVKIVQRDFEKACAVAKPGDAVYFDPPYVPLSRTASFTAYDRYPFGIDEHERLAQVFGDLAERGVTVVLSNSDTKETRELYRGWRVDRVKMSRAINSVPSKRGPVGELLVIGERKVTRRRKR